MATSTSNNRLQTTERLALQGMMNLSQDPSRDHSSTDALDRLAEYCEHLLSQEDMRLIILMIKGPLMINR